MAHIDYYFATLSPYTYLSGQRLAEVSAKHGCTVTFKPLDIMALFARTGGTPPKDRHPSRQAYRLQDLVRSAKKTGFALNEKPMFWPTNPAPSSFAIISAQKAGGGDLGALVHALTRSVWADEKDISQDEVIRACLEEAGFDPALADRDMLASAEEYGRNLEDAVNSGVFGAPFYLVDNTAHFWGQDRIEDLDLYLAGKL